MADRYSDRYDDRDEDRGRNRWRDDDRNAGEYGYRERDRGFIERAGDEVASWFGSDDAERRRERDEEHIGGRRDDRDDDWYGSTRPYTSAATRGQYPGGEQRGSYRPDEDNPERYPYRSTGYERMERGVREDEEFDRSGRGRYGTGGEYEPERDYDVHDLSRRSPGGYQGSEHDRQSTYYGMGAERNYRRNFEDDERGAYGQQDYGRQYESRSRGAYGRQDFRRESGQQQYGQPQSGRQQHGQQGGRWGSESRYDRNYEQTGRGGRPGDRGLENRAMSQQSGYGSQGYGLDIRDDQEPIRGAGRGFESGRQRGPHSGKGPKGYQRSEASVREDICERLMRHGEIDASEIDVKIENGEVTLEGTVDTWSAKRLAEDVVQEISGVKDVLNHLRVRPQGQQRDQRGAAPSTQQPAQQASQQPGAATQPGATPQSTTGTTQPGKGTKGGTQGEPGTSH